MYQIPLRIVLSSPFSLKLIPSTAKHANGMDLEVSIQPSADKWHDVLGDLHTKADIRAALEGAKKHHRAKREQRAAELMSVNADMARAESDEAEATVQASEAQAKKEKVRGNL